MKASDLFGDVKELSGYKFRYFITSTGLVFSFSTGEIKQLKPTLRGKTRNQYLFVRFEKDGKYLNLPVHKLVADNFLGSKPSPNHVVNHKDGNKQNNHSDNLEWVTISENTRHAYLNGMAGGRKHGSYKGPVCAEYKNGFGFVFFDNAQAIDAGFNPKSIRDAISNPNKRLFGFKFCRLNEMTQLRGNSNGGAV
ncbi:HNH endonuclease signature motif containing protein [Atlantibacter hermannii]|uniref:HNH endonuclease signature motif containing protein n=1 Tax=Atlantibacter hermannii TaxID=565 RepID=UPI0028ACFF73|nr:HNH endonuclease signature motif containing protein [Atlantibacter hermannii]